MYKSEVSTTYEIGIYKRKSLNVQSMLFKVSIFLLMLFAFFFGYLNYPVKYMLIFGALFLLLFSSLNKYSALIVFQTQDIFFLLYLLFGIISLFYTDSLSKALVYLGIWSFGILIKLWLPYFRNNAEYIINCLFAFSALHVLATLLQIVFPALMTSINAVILDANTLYWNNLFLSQNAYAGITGQIGTNAFYLSVFVGIAVCKLITLYQKQRYTKYVFIFFTGAAFLALLATQKRGPLLFCVLSILGILYIWYAKTKKNIFRFIWLVTLLGVAIAILLLFTDYGRTLTSRFLYGSYGDIYSGRLPMFLLMWEGFLEKPILGHGLASTSTLVGTLGHSIGHNVYLQSLNDIGLIGTFCLMVFMYKSLERTIRKIRVQSNTTGTHRLIYYLQISLYLQLFVILYGLTGNPIYDHFQFIIYMIACAIPGMIANSSSFSQNNIKSHNRMEAMYEK
jgi:hypothetical protein